MQVRDIMTTRVITVRMDDSLFMVKERLERLKVHHLLVLENKKIVGIISDRDFLRASSPYLNTPAETTRDTNLMNRPAHQIMSRNPITIEADASAQDAAQTMLENNVSCLPVINEEKQLEGLLTSRDLMGCFAEGCQKTKNQAAVQA